MNNYLTLAIILFVYMNIWFILSLLKKRSDLADIAWGLGFGLISITAMFISGNFQPRSILVLSLVCIWGMRLATHIYLRNHRKTEDYRYLAWRKDWGKNFIIRSYLQIFLLQGFFLYLIVISPVITIFHSNANLNFIDLLGIVVWLIGILFEAIGDYQLNRFTKKPNNKGKLITTGLWRYSRHPNYFGEVTLWWGVWILSINTPFYWISIISPITISILIIFVSGIPLLEKKYANRVDYQIYKKQTSIFFPLPSRKS